MDVTNRIISVNATTDTLERAIADVAHVSWRAVNVFFDRCFEEDETELSDELKARLSSVFGAERVETGAKPVGASTTGWPVSALVHSDGGEFVFQVVTANGNSVYRASTAFRDLAGLDAAPKLIAFVRSKDTLGSRLALLAPGRVVEEGQPMNTSSKRQPNAKRPPSLALGSLPRPNRIAGL